MRSPLQITFKRVGRLALKGGREVSGRCRPGLAAKKALGIGVAWAGQNTSRRWRAYRRHDRGTSRKMS